MPVGSANWIRKAELWSASVVRRVKFEAASEVAEYQKSFPLSGRGSWIKSRFIKSFKAGSKLRRSSRNY